MVMGDNTVQIPPELNENPGLGSDETSALAWWQNTDPYAAYLAQMLDYLVELKIPPETIANYVKDFSAYKSMFTVPELHTVIFRGEPAITLQKVQSTEGKRTQIGLKEFREKQDVLRDVVTQGVYTEAGRRKLARAVAKGDISEAWAYQLNPDWQEYLKEEQGKQIKGQREERTAIEHLKSNVYTPGGRRNFIQAVADGLIPPEEAYDQNEDWQAQLGQFERGQKEDKANLLKYGAGSPAGRAKLAEEVAAGRMTQAEAFGPGSAWEKWQHEQVGTSGKGIAGTGGFGAQFQTFRNSEEQNTLIGKINEAREFGIGTGAEEQMIRANEAGPGVAAAAVALNEQIKAKRNAQMEMQNFRTGKLYPLGEGTPETKQRETEMWQKYGDVYGTYRNYLTNIKGMNEYRDIEPWIEENPQIKEYMRKTARQPSAPMPRFR